MYWMNVNDFVLDELGYCEMFDEVFYDWLENVCYGCEVMSFVLLVYICSIMFYEVLY